MAYNLAALHRAVAHRLKSSSGILAFTCLALHNDLLRAGE